MADRVPTAIANPNNERVKMSRQLIEVIVSPSGNFVRVLQGLKPTAAPKYSFPAPISITLPLMSIPSASALTSHPNVQNAMTSTSSISSLLYDDVAAGRFSLAPIITSHSIVATSPSAINCVMENALSPYAENSKPVKLKASHAKQAIISQTPRKRGRNRDLYTSNPNGKSHKPANTKPARSSWGCRSRNSRAKASRCGLSNTSREPQDGANMQATATV